MFESNRILNLSILIFIGNLILFCDSGRVPSEFNLCKRNDPNLYDCITKSARTSLKHFCKGYPAFKVSPLDPLNIGKADVISESASLQLKQKNGIGYGLCDSDIKKIGINPAAKNGSLELTVDIRLVLDVETKGRILLIALDGPGEIDLKLTGLHVDLDFKYDLVKGKDNLDHMRIHDFSYVYKYKTPKFTIKGLFGGNELLGSVVNNVANESPEVIIDELGKPILNVAITKIIQIINKFFNALSYDELLPI